MNIGFRIVLSRFIFYTPLYLAFDIVMDNPLIVLNDDALEKWTISLTFEKLLRVRSMTTQILFRENTRNLYVGFEVKPTPFKLPRTVVLDKSILLAVSRVIVCRFASVDVFIASLSALSSLRERRASSTSKLPDQKFANPF